MSLFEVYQLSDLEPVEARGAYLRDKNGKRYLDFYGGHAVISIGHSHPVYVRRLTQQLNRIGFYSNAVVNSLQQELAAELGSLSGYPDYQLFLCNSGAEANENALKLASFVTGRDRVLAFRGAFHGRTSAAVAVTDNPDIRAPLNRHPGVTFVALNDSRSLEAALEAGQYAAVMVEGIQGVGGIRLPEDGFLHRMREACDRTGTLMVVDEVQSGYGRSGKFFAHQYAGVRPDLITVAKGMGNGFPIGGVLIHPAIPPRKGMLGTTFGGSHLACAAALAVLEVIRRERLPEHAAVLGNYLIEQLSRVPGVTEVRGRGLMIGVDTVFPQAEVRRQLMAEAQVMTGYSGKYTLRLLPPLTITRKQGDEFLYAFRQIMGKRQQEGVEQV